MTKEDPHKTMQFCCSKPCEGQVAIVGAVIRQNGVVLFGTCTKCEEPVAVDANVLLKEMCNFTEGVN